MNEMTFHEWWTLDELRKRLMYVKFEGLKLEHLQPLRDEVTERLKDVKWTDTK